MIDIIRHMTSIISQEIVRLFDDGREVSIDQGQYLFHVGDRVKFMYLVLDGKVELMRHTANGSQMILMTAEPVQVFAEASAYVNQYNCDGVVAEKSSLKQISLDVFKHRLEHDVKSAVAWASSLAHATQKARLLAEIRSMKTVSARLDSWLGKGESLPEKGNWLKLADSLGVSKEALYRELAKRRS